MARLFRINFIQNLMLPWFFFCPKNNSVILSLVLVLCFACVHSQIWHWPSHHRMYTQGLCGLRNIGNTCFMNSIIQCLGHTKDLTSYLKTKGDIRSATAVKDSRIVIEFSKLIKEMWSGANSSVTPSELKSAFSAKHRMYSGCSQQDAQEFLRFFLDALHCALNAGTKGEKLDIDEHLSNNTKADRTWEWYSKVENSVIKDLFVGQLKSSLKCTVCGNSSVTFDPFWDLR